LFTSGSTGTPKGVIINHRAVVDYTDWISNCYGFDESTVFANQAQLYFDLSIQDVYAPMKNGSTTVLIANRMYSAPVRVWKMILENKVNTLVWIPSMLCLFANLDILENVEDAPLKTVLFCGEVMPMKQLNYWIRKYPKVIFGNLYGPTECTDACTYYTVNRKFTDDDVLPMGKPCENSEAFIVDEKGKIITNQGEVGELLVRGSCMSMGYYGDLERTREVFVQNPAQNLYPELVYKTGDLVMYNKFNELVYVSRKDFQVKIKGYRVELGEIEAAASAINEINYNCCLFDGKSEKLILFYTGKVSVDEVRARLSEKLQDYMMPNEYIQLQEMLFTNPPPQGNRREIAPFVVLGKHAGTVGTHRAREEIAVHEYVGSAHEVRLHLVLRRVRLRDFDACAGVHIIEKERIGQEVVVAQLRYVMIELLIRGANHKVDVMEFCDSLVVGGCGFGQILVVVHIINVADASVSIAVHGRARLIGLAVYLRMVDAQGTAQ